MRFDIIAFRLRSLKVWMAHKWLLWLYWKGGTMCCVFVYIYQHLYRRTSFLLQVFFWTFLFCKTVLQAWFHQVFETHNSPAMSYSILLFHTPRILMFSIILSGHISITAFCPLSSDRTRLSESFNGIFPNPRMYPREYCKEGP